MKNFSNNASLFETIVAQMPADVVASLTATQLAELKSSCYQFKWRKHPVDIRLSIPFPGRGIYFVFLAGPERRSLQRLRTENSKYPYKVVVTFSLLAGLAMGGIVMTWQSLQPVAMQLQRSFVHPVSIPWLQSKGECEKTGRIWKDDNCWDSDHSPDF